jgi:hypothetical protein
VSTAKSGTKARTSLIRSGDDEALVWKWLVTLIIVWKWLVTLIIVILSLTSVQYSILADRIHAGK